MSAGLFDLRAGYDADHRAKLDLVIVATGTSVDPLNTDWNLAELRSQSISELAGVRFTAISSAVDDPSTDRIETLVVPAELRLGECSLCVASVENSRIVLRDLIPASDAAGFKVEAIGGSTVAALLNLIAVDDPNGLVFDGVIVTEPLSAVGGAVDELTKLGAIATTWATANSHVGPDIEVTLRNGTTKFRVSFDGLTASHTLGDVLRRINDAAPRIEKTTPLGDIVFFVNPEDFGVSSTNDELVSPIRVDFPHPFLLSGSPGGHLAMLESIEAGFTSLLSTAFFQTPIPLSKGQSLAGMTSLDGAFNQYVISPVKELVDNLRFQGFADLQFSQGRVRITCIDVDLVNKQVKTSILIDDVPAPIAVPFGLTGGAGPLTNVVSTGNATAQTTYTMQFTVGFDFNQLGEPLGSAPLVINSTTPACPAQQDWLTRGKWWHHRSHPV